MQTMSMKWWVSMVTILSAFSLYVVINTKYSPRNSLFSGEPMIFSRSSSGVSSINDYAYNWTIVLSVNEGFREFFLNWWWHFQRLKLNVPIVVEAEDEIVFSKLQAKFQSDFVNHVTVERSTLVSISNFSKHNSDDYMKLVSTRPTHILKYLQEGRNVLYSDIDAIWLKNPFPYFNGSYDMWIERGVKRFCTCFMAIKSNRKTMKLMRDWEQRLNEKLQVNQPVFNEILKASDVQFKKLDTNKFPTSFHFGKFNTWRRSQVVVMHNTFADRHGGKLAQFKYFELWFQTL